MFSSMDKSLRYTFYGIIATFMLLFLATYHTLKIAFSGHEGVMNKDYYEVGLNYEKFIDEQKKLIEEGYHFEGLLFGDHPTLKPGENPVSLRFFKGETPISNAKITLRLEKRATDKFTRISEIPQGDEGKYEGTIEIAAEGKWFLTITGDDNGKVLKKYFSIDVVN